MRTCIVCHQSKDESEFGYRNTEKGHLQSVCIPCRQQQMRDRYANNHDNVRNINQNAREKSKSEAQNYVSQYKKDHPCTDCGESDPVVLTFDHVRGEKKGNVADMVTHGYSLKSIQQEIDKCDCVCANCHTKREHCKRHGI